MAEIVELLAGSDEWEQARALLQGGSDLRLSVTTQWSEPVFEVGDRVRVPADHGLIDAVILSVSREFVRVSYQQGRYTTSLERASVRTQRRLVHPTVVVEVLGG